MQKKFDKKLKVFWKDTLPVVSEVIAETSNKFEILQNEQLKALMLQVKELSEKAGVDLLPVFEEQLKLRDAIMEDHKARKANAEPD